MTRTAPEVADRKGRAARKAAGGKGRVRQDGGVVQHDGRMDVGATLRSRARTVESSELARRMKKVQVLDTATIRGLIKDAVVEVAGHLETALVEDERQRLLEEAEESFRERLESFKAEKARLESQAVRLREQLETAQDLLVNERQRIVSSDQFTVSDAGIIEIEKRLVRTLDRAVAGGEVSAELETHMRESVERLLDDERELISDRAREAQNDRVELLERKVSRLASSLENTQKERDRERRRAQALEDAGFLGLQNTVSGGIDDDDPARDRRIELMREIVDDNKRTYEELAKRGATPRSSVRSSAVDTAVAKDADHVEDA